MRVNWMRQWMNQLRLVRPEPKRPLGRWGQHGGQHGRTFLKTDYANMDSCGDVLCGKPDYFKVTNNCKTDQVRTPQQNK